jgi:hypothetical protein
MKKMWPVREVAALAGVTRQQIWNLAPFIPGAVKVGKQWRFLAADPQFKKWIASRKNRIVSRYTPRVHFHLEKLRKAILGCDPNVLADEIFILLLANVVNLAYREIRKLDPASAKDLWRQIEASIKDHEWVMEEESRGRILGTSGRSAPRMNGERFFTPKSR